VPTSIPGVRFDSAGCTATRCTLPTIAAGSTAIVRLTSDTFRNRQRQTATFTFATSSSDVDYLTTNNQLSSTIDIPVFTDCSEELDEGLKVSCFIATAAYGSPLEPHVLALRQFRDRYLQHSTLGRAFIRYYYRYSPPMAAVIAEHDWLRLLVRMLLTPVVLAIAFPLRALLLGLLVATLLLSAVYRRRAAQASLQPSA
jgi:hypothetical protein